MLIIASEPAILLMMSSIPKYPDITATLLEFLLIMMEYFDPPRKDFITRGVRNAMGLLLEKGVVRYASCYILNYLIYVLFSSVDSLFHTSNYLHVSVLEKAQVLLAPFYKPSDKQVC